MENRKPSVSVVMPVYNVEKYVALAIQSVLNQTYRDWELLIIDDAGQDASLEICASFRDERIRIISQENRGLAGARNTGIRHARGEFVAFLDSDDLWHPEKLARHVSHLQSSPRIGVSYCASELIDDAGNEIGIVQMPKLRDIRQEDVFLRNPVGNGSVPVIRRAVLDDIEFEGPEGRSCWFDETFRQSEDIECWTRIALTTSWAFEGIGEKMTFYRINEGGLSANVLKQFDTWNRMCDKIEAVAPAFHEKWYALAAAFQLRYLSRRAARMRNGSLALSLLLRSLKSDFSIVWREPKKTSTTVCAVMALCLLPSAIYEHLEDMALRRAPAKMEA